MLTSVDKFQIINGKCAMSGEKVESRIYMKSILMQHFKQKFKPNVLVHIFLYKYEIQTSLQNPQCKKAKTKDKTNPFLNK